MKELTIKIGDVCFERLRNSDWRVVRQSNGQAIEISHSELMLWFQLLEAADRPIAPPVSSGGITGVDA